MSRVVPAELQAHLDGHSTTTCRLLKIVGSANLSPRFAFGLCELDRDVEYDDDSGDGATLYSAANGFNPATMAADLGFSVANSEGYSLVSSSPIDGVTEELINSGALDDATWVCYLVNFEDLTPGRHVILDAGDVGQIRVRHGVLWLPELLSYAMRLKQPVGGVWSRKCRAIFGSPANSPTGCGVDAEALWVEGTVTAVGSETGRAFTGDVVASLPSVTYPGRVLFLTGDNAGREYPAEEVDGFDVELLEPARFPIQIGDTYLMRRDCQKRFEEDCIALYDNGLNFKGEPLIPTGDAAQVMSPGSEIPGGTPFSETESDTESETGS